MEVLGHDNPNLARIRTAIETLQLSPSACVFPTLRTARHIKVSSDGEGESEFMAATKAKIPKEMKIADKMDFDVELIVVEKKRVDVEERRLKVEEARLQIEESRLGVEQPLLEEGTNMRQVLMGCLSGISCGVNTFSSMSALPTTASIFQSSASQPAKNNNNPRI